MRRTRILFMNPNSEIGGSDVSLLELLRCLDGTRYEVVVGLPGPGPLVPEFQQLGARVLYLPILPVKRFRFPWEAMVFFLRCAFCLWPLRREIRRVDPDVVHLNSLVLVVPGLAARLAGKRIVWHVREIIVGPGWVGRVLTWIAALLADRIVVISKAVGACFPKHARAKLQVVYNGVDLERFDPGRVDGAGVRAEFGIAEGAPVVGFVGRLVPWKGADRFLRACGLVAREHPEARFVVVGSTLERYEGYARRLEGLAGELGLGDRVVFAYGRRDMPEILAGMDVFVHASVRPEPFGLVIIEAMAMGRAVVATRGGGVPEIVDGPDVGELVEPGDVDGMARAVVGLLGDAGRRERMGRAARAKALREFRIEGVARRLEGLYADLTRGGRVRIGFINSTSEIGGADIDLLRTVQELDKGCWDPVVVLPRDGPLVESLESAGAEVVFSEVFAMRRAGGPLRWFWQAATAAWGVGLLGLRYRGWRLDLVHTNSLVLPSAAFAAWVSRRPLVCHAREITVEPHWVGLILCGVAGVVADSVVAISSAVAGEFPAWARRKVQVVRHGVDLERFDPGRVDGAGVRAEFGIAEGAPVVGFVGRLVPWKGADRFLRACALVARAHPEARFVVVGSTLERYEGYARRLEGLAGELGLGDRVVFACGRRDVPEILAGMDVFVHASVRPEPFGLVIIEAMAMGRAVVATRGGGVPEIVDGPDVGELVEPGDVDGMARAVVGLLGDAGRRERMGRAARAKALREYDVRLATRSIERIYREVLDGRGVRLVSAEDVA